MGRLADRQAAEGKAGTGRRETDWGMGPGGIL